MLYFFSNTIEDLPALTEQEEAKLVEVKDKELLAKIDQVVPGTLKTVADTLAVAAHKKAGPVYRAIIPNGAKLDKSKETEGAFRSTYRGKDGRINGQAVLIEDKTGDHLAALGSVDALMNVASMVVGQYYMTQINDQLKGISEGIEGVLMTLPGLLDNDLNYIELKEETVAQIKHQVAPVPVMNSAIDGDYYQEDVRLIAKDGKLFYLPQQSVG